MKPTLLPVALFSIALFSSTAMAQSQRGGPPASMPGPAASMPQTTPPSMAPGVDRRDTARADRQAPTHADEHALENADENAGLAPSDEADAPAPPLTSEERRDVARDGRAAPDNANENALERADANAGLADDAPSHPLTTDELNRREAARLRALGAPAAG